MRNRQDEQPVAKDLVNKAVGEPAGREAADPLAVRASKIRQLCQEADQALHVGEEIGAEPDRTCFVELRGFGEFLAGERVELCRHPASLRRASANAWAAGTA